MVAKTWKPTIRPGESPLYSRIGEAVACAIAAGELPPGQRLPTHRELAWRLSVSVGSVTRAYEDLARRGLIESTVGRGSFVAALENEQGPVDLSRNVPPIGPSRAALQEAFTSLRNRSGIMHGLEYGPPIGTLRDRAAGRDWLCQTARLELSNDTQVLCTSCAHAALLIALGVLCKPGDAILCEAATYTGLIALAAQFDYRLCPIDLDKQGASPDALERAAKKRGARVVVLTPTLQNPTGRIMSAARRDAIARIARRNDLWIIEDDIYGAFARDEAPAPLANRAPERTMYVSSLSKVIAPGLRAGYLTVPAKLQNRVADVINAFAPTQSGLGQAIATHWIESGLAAQVLEGVIDEARRRVEVALGSLRERVEKPQCQSAMHLWWPCDARLGYELAERAMREGVVINKPDLFAVEKTTGPTGIRICLGGASSSHQLRRACNALIGDAGGSALADVATY